MLNTLLSLRKYLFNGRFLYSLRIAITLAGVTILPWIGQETILIVPLILGVIAAGLSDLDDSLSGRLLNLLITLFCFFLASASVELLMPYPVIFLMGLLLSTSGFIMLGALGQRYATIAFGTLLIAIYTMMGDSAYSNWYQQPLLLLAGALWYNFIALIAHLILPVRPVQEELALCFRQLADYLDSKAALFDPDEEDQFQPQRIALSMVNSRLINTLNQTRIHLQSRLEGDRGQRNTRRMLSYFFIAQEISERASASHVAYQQLSERFRYSDVLFRLQRLLMQQANACRQLAKSVVLSQKYEHSVLFNRAFSHLDQTMARLRNTATETDYIQLLAALNTLINNLKAIDIQLAGVDSEQTLMSASMEKANVKAERLNGFKDICIKIYRNLTPQSALFRHAVRMGIVLSVGCVLIYIFQMEHGYWILLTSLFVCQPNYNATRYRLKFRLIGTIMGSMIGLFLLYLVPSVQGMLILTVISGVLFFVFRHGQYAYSTAFITLLALFCFRLLYGQVDDGFSFVWPRLLSTILGCAIAGLAVSYIWPDWKFRRLDLVIEKTMLANRNYLQAIQTQYHEGRTDDLTYRIASDAAHTCDGELAVVISNLSSEPKLDKNISDQSFRLLCLNHTLLGYITALGANRMEITASEPLHIVDQSCRLICGAFSKNFPNIAQIHENRQKLAQWINGEFGYQIFSDTQIITQQLILLLDVLPELIELRNSLISDSFSVE